MKTKSKHAGLAHEIGFWLCITPHFAVARHQAQERRAPTHLQTRKSVGNNYDLTSASDWSITMIGSGGLC
jgi:hypothetical protein